MTTFQKEIPEVFKNVRELIGDRDIDLEVDGGIDNTNIAKSELMFFNSTARSMRSIKISVV